jgi:hypothetical protein
MSDKLTRLSDRELLAELRVYNDAVTAAPSNFNLTAFDATALKADLDAFEALLDGWDAVNAQYESELEAKTAGRRQVLRRGRSQRTQTRAKIDISNELLAAAGIPPKKASKTPSPSPSSVPFALIELGKLRHTIKFRDKQTPATSKKPDGMLGAEIWLKIGGEPPVDNKECQYLATDTATPFQWTFESADVGKTAWYLLRWISKNGDKGDWSDAVGATING